MAKEKSKIRTVNSQSLSFPSDFIDKFINGDVLDVLKKIPDESVDLAVTSPPYNLKNSTGNGMKDGRGGKWASAALLNGYATYDDNMPYDEYILACRGYRGNDPGRAPLPC